AQVSEDSLCFVEHGTQQPLDKIHKAVPLPADDGSLKGTARKEALDGLNQPPLAEMFDVPIDGIRNGRHRCPARSRPDRCLELVAFETEVMEHRTKDALARERHPLNRSLVARDG